MHLESSQLQQCHFSNAILSDLRIGGSDLTGALFDNCDCRRADLRNATVENAVVKHSDFGGTALHCVTALLSLVGV